MMIPSANYVLCHEYSLFSLKNLSMEAFKFGDETYSVEGVCHADCGTITSAPVLISQQEPGHLHGEQECW